MIYLGTSGYSYDDWRHIYYPANVARGGWLAYYASEFRAVELNFSYYQLPTVNQIARLAEQTPDDFFFTAKAHRDITHNQTGDPVVFAKLKAGLAPLQEAGKLGAILLQFPFSFRNDKHNTYYLQHCAKQFDGLPWVVEFRHNSWITQRTLSMLREWEAGFCNVDMPALPGLLPHTAFVTATTAYVRFHGRNADQWWRHEEAWQRYNYTYTAEELEEWVPHLRTMNEEAENLFAFANNHWQAQSVRTVRQIKMLLEEPTREG
jgi:uncharacterized protein YecE (DUF72 family)